MVFWFHIFHLVINPVLFRSCKYDKAAYQVCSHGMQEVVTVAPNRLANYEQKKREFFKEHLHEHEEVRLILEGSGNINGIQVNCLHI